MKYFRTIYKTLARSRQLTRHHIVQYAALKAMDNDYQVRQLETLVAQASYYINKAFTPIRRKTLLDNGREPFDTLYYTVNGIGHSVLSNEPNVIFDTDLEEAEYRSIIEALKKKYSFIKTAEYCKRHYVYTFVRQDISPEYQLVQAAHATAKMAHRTAHMIPINQFDELYFAVIGVANDKEMAVAIRDCKEVGLKVYPFYEPDIGDILTAFSTSPVRADQRKRLLSYKKLRFKKN